MASANVLENYRKNLNHTLISLNSTLIGQSAEHIVKVRDKKNKSIGKMGSHCYDVILSFL